MRKIEVRAHNTRTQFVRSEMEPHWKVARPCLQTVKSWARGTGRGESRGVQKPPGSTAYAQPYIVHCPVLRRRATPKNPLHQLSTGANFKL